MAAAPPSSIHPGERSPKPVTGGFRLQVTANFSAEPMARVLGFWATRLGWPADSIRFSGYGQVFAELLDPGSASGSREPGANLFLIRVEDWGRDAPDEEKRGVVERAIEECATAFASFVERSGRPSWVFLARPTAFAAPARSGDSKPGGDDGASGSAFYEMLTARLAARLRALPHVTVVDHSRIASVYALASVEDPVADRTAHIPFSDDYWVALGTVLIRQIRAALHPPHKVIVVDADNTLWDGVVAEVGAKGIGLEPARRELQRFLQERQQQGMLLALASKNREADVQAAFDHPDMVLRREDFAAWAVNWQPKSETIRQLGRDLALGLESFVFVDDNPVECAEVGSRCPQVTVIPLPPQAEAATAVIRHVWALDTPPATSLDRKRTEHYRQQAMRGAWRAQSTSFRDFIESLGLRVECRDCAADDLERAAQLTLRTNQFNTTGIRRTAAELGAWLHEAGHGGLFVEVADRFGDYGGVGFVAYRVVGTTLEVETFLLSCRVLGKGVEHRMMADLAARARRLGGAEILMSFRRTDRNEPAERFLVEIHGAPVSEPGCRITVAQAQSVRFSPADTEPEAHSVQPDAAEEKATASGTSGPLDFAGIAREVRDIDCLRRAMRGAVLKERPTGSPRFIAPQPGTEERLARIWENVLGLAPVGRDDDFLQLGGSSIQAVQVISRVASAWHVRLALVDFFSNSRLPAMAEHIARETPKPSFPGPAEEVAPESCLPRAESLSLTPAQERMWFLDQFIPRRSAYNIVSGWRLSGDLDPTAWEAALRAVVERHEPLRTTFHADGPERAVVDSTPRVTARFLTVASESEAWEVLRAEASATFDLSQAALLRTCVASLAHGDHWCLFTVHHVAADGWSLGILLREWSAAYAAIKAGQTPTWEPLPARYRDYAAWLLTPEVKARCEADWLYWKRQLEGAPRLLELPSDRPRAPIRKYEGGAETSDLTPETTTRVQNAAAALGTTPFAVLLAAFQTLLHRHSGQHDILVGTAVSGRTHPATESMIGCFVNTLVLRNSIEGTTPFRDQVHAASQTVWEALEHDQLPFERLIDALNLERDLSHSPLFQVMLILQNTPPGAPAADGWRVEPIMVHNSGSKFDLVLEITPHPRTGNYRLVLEYDSSLFERATIRRWLGHFERLLDAACLDPDRALSDLPLMGEDEMKEIHDRFGQRRQLHPNVGCLHTWFEQVAAATPDAPAITFEGRSLSYGELNRHANRLAHRLIRCGVKPDTLVGLYAERSPELVLAILAVLKAGGAYVPIDRSYPADRLAFMLEDADAPLLLTQRSWLGSLPTGAAQIVLIDDETEEGSADSEENPAVPVGPDHLAYVIYTSGSTGKPKGCMITHRNVSRLMRATEPWFQFGPSDVWTLFHSSAFDFSVWEIWGPLLYGGRLVIVPYLVSRSPEAFYDLIADEAVTVLNQTPSAFQQLIQVEETGSVRPLSLRYVIFGGEALELHRLKPWFDRHGDASPRLVNMYGITETTVHVTYRPLGREDSAKGSVIGVPIPDLEFHILDAHQNPVPLGIPGEIYVGGDGVARGYLRRDDLTAARFVPHPRPGSAARDGREAGRLYRTGDLARFLPGGDVEFLGRIDSQVKIRGFRIELGEIESILCQHEAVREAVAVARVDPPGEKRLVAYLTVRPGAPDPAASDLREHLKRQVPDYMVPSAFVTLPRLPLTNNGKVDHRSLPDPGLQRMKAPNAHEAPASSLERTVARICQEALRLEAIGVEDNFFDLGAHSILLVNIHREIQATLGRRFPLVTLFHFPTIRGLAQSLGAEATDGSQSPEATTGGSADRARRQREATLKFRQHRSPHHSEVK